MLNTLLVVSFTLICILILIALWIMIHIQRRSSERLQAQQHAWERAQEARQRQWQEQQSRHTREIERHLTSQVNELHSEWQQRDSKDSIQTEKLSRRYEDLLALTRVESELARLPRVEDMPLPDHDPEQHHSAREQRQPPDLRGAILTRHDLSYRYLARADLRNARLTQANLFMADLSGAHLAGANLAGADLTAANLAHADLRAADLREANLLVTDLNKTLLAGANLCQARNLTPEQISKAIIDKTTDLDAAIDITLPALPRITQQSSSEKILHTQ